MNILQELEESAQSYTTYYIDFLYRYDPKKKQVFAFYEGDEDSSFYHRLLKKYIGEDCELEEIVAGCKNNILKLQREFNWECYDNKQIVFFVDRDLSHWLGESINLDTNIFVTDEYSIENYIVNSTAFKVWLVNFEGFSRANKKEIDYMLDEFNSCIYKFKDKMIPIMAKAIVAKRKDKDIRLSDFKISKENSLIFKFIDNHISFDIKMSQKVLEEKWLLSSMDDTDIQNQIKCIYDDIIHYSVRGKWLLCFMAELGEFMRLNPNIFAPSLKVDKKLSPTCSVSPAQCFVALAPHCTEIIPDSLENFLEKTYRLYLGSFSME